MTDSLGKHLLEVEGMLSNLYNKQQHYNELQQKSFKNNWRVFTTGYHCTPDRLFGQFTVILTSYKVSKNSLGFSPTYHTWKSYRQHTIGSLSLLFSLLSTSPAARFLPKYKSRNSPAKTKPAPSHWRSVTEFPKRMTDASTVTSFRVVVISEHCNGPTSLRQT